MRLLQRVTPGGWPVLTDGAFQHALACLIHRDRPRDPGRPVLLSDPDRERAACGLAWWLGVFDLAARTGRAPAIPASARSSVESLFAMVDSIGFDDMAGIVRAAGDGSFMRLRARVGGAADAAVGVGGVGDGADVLLGRTQITLWTTTDLGSLTSLPGAVPLLCQLVGSLFLEDADVQHVGIYLTRQRLGVSWPVDALLTVCAHPAPRRHLRDHRHAPRAILDMR